MGDNLKDGEKERERICEREEKNSQGDERKKEHAFVWVNETCI